MGCAAERFPSAVSHDKGRLVRGRGMLNKQLFHFDVKTFANYGDTLLFEAVRQLFNTYDNRRKFFISGSRSLRTAIGPAAMRGINQGFDGVVLGGGGLFLRDTNPNDNSGWQWNCSTSTLAELAVPLILFAVGYNRFIGQTDFAPVFSEHVNATVEKAAFVGLRNNGSIRALSGYLRPELREKLVYQPCVTTISSFVMPEFYRPDLTREKRVGFQISLDKRQEAAGFDKAKIFRELSNVVKDLKQRGWEVEVVAHVATDEEFHQHLSEHGVTTKLVKLHGIPRGIYTGLEYYAGLPLVVGMRGHGQMIPFGIGSGIISIMVHEKLKYFLEDINHEHLCLDPRDDGFERNLSDLIDQWYEDFDASRQRLSVERLRLFQITMDNMATIARLLTGDDGEPSLLPYGELERELATNSYVDSMHRDADSARVMSLASKIQAIRKITN